MTRENYRFALCVVNKDCEDLEKRKIYQVIPDENAASEGFLRVIDESGEDYLYPQSYFILRDVTRHHHRAHEPRALLYPATPARCYYSESA